MSELEIALKRAHEAIREARNAVADVYLALDSATWDERDELRRVELAHDKGVAAEQQSLLIHIGEEVRRWRREAKARRLAGGRA